MSEAVRRVLLACAAVLACSCSEWREDRLLAAEFVYRVSHDPERTQSEANRGFFERHRAALTGGEAAEWWIAYAAAEAAEARTAAAFALGESRRLRAAPALARLLRDSDGGVRRSAAEAWGKLRPPPASNRPLLVATRDPDGWVRAAACASVGALGAAEGAGWLIERLADDNGLVRAAAATALAKVDGSRAQRELEPLLQDPNGAVRLAVRNALQELKSGAAAARS